MSVKLGQTSIGAIYLGATKIGQAYLGSTKVYSSTPVDPYNPLGLPPYTIRLKLSETPVLNNYWDSVSLVSEGTDYVIYDFTRKSENSDWSSMSNNVVDDVNHKISIIEVLGANTTGVTSTRTMFSDCTSLVSVALFDTSSVTNSSSMFSGCTSLVSIPLFDTSSSTSMAGMFYGCTSLVTIPLFNTSSVRNMGGRSGSNTYRGTFEGCVNVESGALALYQQASTQTTPPTTHALAFTDCGSNTTSGAAELAQIPASWGGTGEG